LDVRHAENIYKQMGKEGKILLTNTQMIEVTIHAEDKQSTNRKKEDT
jgi:riboflavin synthase